MNGAIRAPELRVIDEDGSQLGVLSRSEALELARERELDLVEISPNTNPPVAKIVDWGKVQLSADETTSKKQEKRQNSRGKANALWTQDRRS